MPDLIDAQVERATTRPEPARAELEGVLEAERRANPQQVLIIIDGDIDTAVRIQEQLLPQVNTGTPFAQEQTEVATSLDDLSAPLCSEWKNVSRWVLRGDLHAHNIVFETRATTSTATTVTAFRKLLRRTLRDERISHLSAERRQLYERMMARRKEISRDEFDIDAAIREFREDG